MNQESLITGVTMTKESGTKKGLRGDIDDIIPFLLNGTFRNVVKKIYKKRGVLTIEGELHIER